MNVIQQPTEPMVADGWWVGKEFHCDQCGCIFALDAYDRPRIQSSYQWRGANASCPRCDNNVRIDNGMPAQKERQIIRDPNVSPDANKVWTKDEVIAMFTVICCLLSALLIGHMIFAGN